MLESQVACFESFFRETFWENLLFCLYLALFLKLREAEVIKRPLSE